MRIPKTDIPGLILRSEELGSRIAFLPADIDREYGRSNLPDHGDLLKNIVLWAAGGHLSITVEGAGLVDVHLYRQHGRLVLHLVNLTNENTWRQSLDELISIGPLQVKVRLPTGPAADGSTIDGHRLRLLVADRTAAATVSSGWCHFTIDRVLDHEVVVIG